MIRLAVAALSISMVSAAGATEADLRISRAGTRPVNPAPAQHFGGSATVEMLLASAGPDRASVGSAMTHLAITEAQDGKTVDWLEPVAEAQGVPGPAVAAPMQPSRAQRLIGDVAPKLAQLTDEVLFGDVWARPGLSPRDRSLVTVSALIALNRPDQLRSHMVLGRTNGLTNDEIVETLTHLAFYTGWPNAVTAAGVAREVFSTKP